MYNHRLNIYSIFLIILFSCLEEAQIVNSHDIMLAKKEGVLYYDSKLFSGIITNIYHDGMKRSKQFYNEGRRHGEYHEWYPNGQQRYSKQYDNGIQNGEQKEWYRNGILSRKMEFNQGRQEGDQIGWKENGDLRFKYTYINGKRYGFMGTSLCQAPER
jgi:antitoxin component YwqK of YwqJK toxin-antitoxin module